MLGSRRLPRTGGAAPWPRLLTAVRAIAAAAAATAVAAVVVVGLLVAPPGRTRAPRVVHRMLLATLSASTAKMSFSAAVRSRAWSANLEGTGGAAFATGTAAFHVTGLLDGQPETASVVESKGVLYLEVAQIARLVPGKVWVSAALPGPRRTRLETSARALGQMVNPAVVLAVLAAAGGAVQTLGASRLDGRLVTGYRVVMSASEVARAARRTGLAGPFAGDVDSLTASLYASGGLLREVDVGASGPASVHATVRFLRYGEPVDVQAPPATSVVPFAQFLERSPAALTAPGTLV